MSSVFHPQLPSASGPRVVSGVQGALRAVRRAYESAIRQSGLEPEQFDLLTLLIGGRKDLHEVFESLAMTSEDPAALVRRSIDLRFAEFDADGQLMITRDGLHHLATLKPTLEEMNRQWREKLSQAFPATPLDRFFGMLRTESFPDTSIPPRKEGHPIEDERKNSPKGETR